MSEKRYQAVELRLYGCEFRNCSMPATHSVAFRGCLFSGRYCAKHAYERAAFCNEQHDQRTVNADR